MENEGLPLSAWPDRDLVVAFKGGVPGAYEEMYRRYSERVQIVCRKMLGSREDANEATQETFLKAYLALPRFNGQYRLGAWLGRIASNVCLDHIRKRGRTAPITLLKDGHEHAATEAGPEDVVVRDVAALRALEEIQPLHARALELRNLEGLSHKEIAEQLSMSPMQVKALLHRARVSFKRAWEQASGWALAPLIGLRSLLHQGSRDAASAAQMPMWSQVTAPLIAEKVTATAMVVAIAISGAAGSTIGSAQERSAQPRTDSLALADQSLSTDVPDVDAGAADKTEQQEEAALPAVDELVTEVQQTADEHKPKTKEKDKDDGDKGGFNPFAPQKASSKVVSKVNRTVEELLHK
jgi:RNA polymerase sigma-70 factor, ECF subfamily